MVRNIQSRIEKPFVSQLAVVFSAILMTVICSSTAFSDSKLQICINNHSAIHVDIKDENESWVFDLPPNMGDCFSVNTGEVYSRKFTASRHDTEEVVFSYQFNGMPRDGNLTWIIE